jgi:short-subunit dehydrogenase
MIRKGSGYFLQIISAAGLLSQIGNAAYSTSKHASIGFAESLLISHGGDGIKVSVACPQFVATSMIGLTNLEVTNFPQNIIVASEVADAVIKGLEKEEFLILPHPEVKQHFLKKANDYQRWLSGMTKIKQRALSTHGDLTIKSIIKSL